MTGFWMMLAAAGGYYWWRTVNDPRIPNLPPPARRLLLLPIIEEGAVWDLTPLAHRLAPRLGFVPDIEVMPLVLPQAAFDTRRSKYDAAALARMMTRRCSPELAVIGLVGAHLYSSVRPDLPFAMGAREGLGAVISAHYLKEERLEKMILRYAGEMVFGLARSEEPTSLLFRELTQPEELDLMAWRY